MPALPQYRYRAARGIAMKINESPFQLYFIFSVVCAIAIFIGMAMGKTVTLERIVNVASGGLVMLIIVMTVATDINEK
jgi:LytS/YehU family sensor histidine kinase